MRKYYVEDADIERGTYKNTPLQRQRSPVPAEQYYTQGGYNNLDSEYRKSMNREKERVLQVTQAHATRVKLSPEKHKKSTRSEKRRSKSLGVK